MTTDFARRVVQLALMRLGRCYIWGGKGVSTWTLDGPRPTALIAGCDEGYDCVGLVTACVRNGGGPDYTMNADCNVLWHSLPPPIVGEPRPLRFYGRPERVDHVGIELGPQYQLEAGGGDHTTKTQADALKRGANVRVIDIERGRQDFLGYRSLAAMQSLLSGKAVT